MQRRLKSSVRLGHLSDSDVTDHVVTENSFFSFLFFVVVNISFIASVQNVTSLRNTDHCI